MLLVKKIVWFLKDLNYFLVIVRCFFCFIVLGFLLMDLNNIVIFLVNDLKFFLVFVNIFVYVCFVYWYDIVLFVFIVI